MAPTAKKTRPTRQATGRTSLPSGYVNTNEALKGEDEDYIATSEEDDLPPAAKRAKTMAYGKKARTVLTDYNNRRSPPILPLSPQVKAEFDEELPTSPTMSDLNALDNLSNAPNTLAITLNVPQEHKGPITLSLDLASILNDAKGKGSSGPKLQTKRSLRSTGPIVPAEVHGPPLLSESLDQTMFGWPDLPPELRNKIYDQVFLFQGAKAISFFDAKHSTSRYMTKEEGKFSLSGQFLRTCKQVHAEGTQVLYGNNKFQLNRQHMTRGHYWSNVWHEVGYKDCRQFLTDINPINISLLRDITIRFDDGKPSNHSPDTPQDDLRFVYDEHVISCLKLLADYGQLKTLKLDFGGRRETTGIDARFLNNLKKLRADKLTIEADKSVSYHYWGNSTSKYRVNPATQEWITKKIERSVPLYPERKKLKRGHKVKGKKGRGKKEDAEKDSDEEIMA